ncbi:MAG: trimeric intracellular cation channel family protein [Ectothiorhodospiraceae bacterium]|nr:trimeric intracellular cation channel family protein [Ectothiorhodospiraceae bacterium]
MAETALLDIVIVAIDAIATVAFAASGLLEAARKRLDPVGVCIVAGVAAFGGGTLRDILLDQRPLYWVEYSNWLWVLLIACALAMAWMRTQHVEFTRKTMQWPDALGLGLFCATGTQIAYTQGMPAIVCVLMGVITATFGGVLRDIICNEVPTAFKDHRPYVLCAFAGGWTLIAAHELAVAPRFGVPIAAGVAVALRLLSLALDLRLPGWAIRRD